MRYLFISTDARPMSGGIASCLDGWMNGLCELGHEVVILSMLPAALINQTAALPARLYREEWLAIPARSPSALDSIWPIRKLRTVVFLTFRHRQISRRFEALAESFLPDWAVFAVLRQTCCVPLPIAARMKIACAGIAYGSEVNSRNVAVARWLIAKLGRFDRLIAISTYTRGLLLNWGIAAAQIGIVHPSVSVDLASNCPAQIAELAIGDLSLERPVRLITICRLVERKGIQIVLRALASIRKEIPYLEYHIIGDGEFRDNLQALSKSLEVDDIVYFHGYLPEQARNKLLQASDIFVMIPFETELGDVEGFGIVYLEAGLFGKPVIASQSGGIADAVKQHETGIIIPPADVEAAAHAIRELALNRATRAKFGSAGIEWARVHSPRQCGEALFASLNAR